MLWLKKHLAPQLFFVEVINMYRHQITFSYKDQKGAAFLLIVFILSLISTAIVVGFSKPRDARLIHGAETANHTDIELMWQAHIHVECLSKKETDFSHRAVLKRQADMSRKYARADLSHDYISIYADERIDELEKALARAAAKLAASNQRERHMRDDPTYSDRLEVAEKALKEALKALAAAESQLLGIDAAVARLVAEVKYADKVN